MRGIIAVSRSFGDSEFDKKLEIISEPDYHFLELDPNECKNSYLVIGSDGVNLNFKNTFFFI